MFYHAQIIFIIRVTQYFSTGIIDHDLQKTLSRSDPSFNINQYVKSIYEVITMEDLKTLFKQILIAWLLCVSVFLIEVATFWFPLNLNNIFLKNGQGKMLIF